MKNDFHLRLRSCWRSLAERRPRLSNLSRLRRENQIFDMSSEMKYRCDEWKDSFYDCSDCKYFSGGCCK